MVLVPLTRLGERVCFIWWRSTVRYGGYGIARFGEDARWREKVAPASTCFSFSGHVEEQI